MRFSFKRGLTATLISSCGLLTTQIGFANENTNSQTPTEEGTETQTFGEKLETRRISDYSDPSRRLFGRSVELTVSAGINASSGIDLSGYDVSGRTVDVGVGIAGGISDDWGYSISTSAARSKQTSRFDGFFGFEGEEFSQEQRSNTASAGLSYKISRETASMPSVSSSLGFTEANVKDGPYTRFASLGLNFTRNLESSAIYGGLGYSWQVSGAGENGDSLSGNLGVALVVNHRFSLSSGVVVSRSPGEDVNMGVSFGMNYGIERDLIANVSVSTPLTSENNSASLNFSLTSLFNSQLVQ